jgi:Zn-dependent protease
MKNQVKLGRYFGVEVGLHFSWFIIAYLIVLSVAQDFRAHNPAWSPQTVWVTALLTGFLFFVTLVIHELAHSLVARAHGIPVKQITLFALGGVSQIEKESENARTEFWIGIAGPIASFVIGGGCLGLAHALGWVSGTPHQPPMALLVWLGYINLGLAFFNLIPGFPLDGGRVMRALIWWSTGDGARATRLAARVGHWVAMALILTGVFRFFRGEGVNGLWLASIGWFLNQATQATTLKAGWEEALKGLSAKDVMTLDSPAVASNTDLETFVHDFLLTTGQPCFIVTEHGQNVGLLTAQDAKRVDKTEWAITPVRRVMQRLEELRTVPADASAKTVLDTMTQAQVNQLAVVSNGHVNGIITLGHIVQLIHAHSELHP